MVSAVLLGSIRRPEPPPPPAADREPVVDEIREGLRLVVHDPVLRGLAWGTMGLAAMWGVFGATWLLFVTDDLSLDPAAIGVIAALGGFGSLLGALLAERAVRRFGLGRVVVVSLLFAALGNLLIPLAPAGLPLVAIACLIGQQLIGDTAVTVFDVTEVSVRQARVGDRQLGRVNATVRVAMVLAQLGGTLVGGLVAEAVGLRWAAFLAPAWALLGAGAMFASPVRRLSSIAACRRGARALPPRAVARGGEHSRCSNAGSTRELRPISCRRALGVLDPTVSGRPDGHPRSHDARRATGMLTRRLGTPDDARSVEQRRHERVGVERQEVVGLLAHPDEPDRDAELLLDREHDAALRGRVELRQHDAGEPHRGVERLGLGEPVLAGGRIEDEERLDGRARAVACR